VERGAPVDREAAEPQVLCKADPLI